MMKKRPRGSKKRRGWPRLGDITREIAISKALTRVHGPFMKTCTACGERYWPDKKEKHIAHCLPAAEHVQAQRPPTNQAITPQKVRTSDPDRTAKLRFISLLRAAGKRTCP